ncbi:ferritin, heavy polypeptide 1a isoform X2 [Hypanus sabinus]|uniref:ferritin, heavy polypeptide 1a isoform X2 n=1 Tax=Hypanus sabinus TaxID=79690 RepID=UPI0028C45063|nr:ferritin, heavy polypeptide 1a isoform X2 [Hypanus sabinus]
MSSQVRQNYHPDCEAAVSRQINLELYASYVYLSMSYYFDRDDIALKNFASFFLEQSHEEREHAEKLMKLQNQRGGRTLLQDIKKPDRDEWGSGLDAMVCSLELEKSVNQSLLELHKLATDRNDPHTSKRTLDQTSGSNMSAEYGFVTFWRPTTWMSKLSPSSY